jgi:hypothetical protein
MKFLSGMETVIAAFARGTVMRSPAARRVMPSVVDADLIFISDYLVNICFRLAVKRYLAG